MPAQFPFLDWLNEQPEVAYYAGVNRLLSPAQRRYFAGGYSDFYNRYLGGLGQQVQAGQEPTMRFTDWLAQNPFTERYAQLPFGVRNPNWGSLRPMTRWIV